MGVKLETMYEVVADKVYLTIIIGEKQIGSSLVKLNNEILQMGDIKNLEIGLGSDIAGKTLITKTVVTDVNDQTNRTSVSYFLKGGKTDKDFSLDATVAEEGASIIYRAKFKLTS